MILGILKEPDQRVAVPPESAKALVEMDVTVMVESGAGSGGWFSDEEYRDAGARTAPRDQTPNEADMLIGIAPPSDVELDGLTEEKVLIAVLNPLSEKELVDKLLAKNITSFSLDNIPRITRAQALDILSSMASIAGYKAVLMAANRLPKFFPMFITAAGTIVPAKVLVLGAGVAGLQAIATAKRLGAVVEAFDVRAAAKEDVLSLGAKFVEVEGARDEAEAGGYAVEQTEEYKQKQQALVQEHAAKSNVIITTAQIPGRTAPRLVTKATVEKMKPGSVIVDLAASTGGNCELTENNKTIEHQGVTIIGDSNLPAYMPVDASKMLGKNIVNLMKLLISEGELNLDFEDEIIKGTCVTHHKEIVSDRVKNILKPQD